MLTQRPAVINKNLLSQAETLIAMKMTGPQDRKAIRDWMDAHDPEKAQAVENDLAKLVVGEAWAWVPGADFLERVRFPLFETYDSGRTPKHGEKVGDVALRKLDVAELAGALAPTAEPQDSEVDQLRRANARLIARNAELEERHRADRRENDRLLAAMTGAQDAIGAAIGSARIVPLPAGAEPDDFVMLVDADDVVRPFPREPGPGRRIAGARSRMADAPAPPAAALAGPAGAGAAAIAALTDQRLAEALAGDAPAVRRVVATVAYAGSIERADIPALAGVSPTSSHITVGLRRLVERGILAAAGDRFELAPAYSHQPKEHS